MSHFLIAIAFVLASAIVAGPRVDLGPPGECLQIPPTGDVPAGHLLPHMSDLAGRHALIPTSDGGAMAVGAVWGYRDTAFPSSLQGFAFWAQKFDAVGQPVWTRRYSAERHMEALAVAEGFDGQFLMMGRVASLNHDLVLLSIDPYGEELWRQTHRLGLDTQPRALVAAHDGGFVVANSVRETARGPRKSIIVKVDSAGDLLWSSEIAPWTGPEVSPNTNINDIEALETGGYVAIGTSYTDQQRLRWLVHLDELGQITQESIFSEFDVPALISITSVSEGFAIAGLSIDNETRSLWFAIVNRDGYILSSRTISGSFNITPRSIVSLANGDLLISGTKSLDRVGSALMMRIDESGNQIWCRHYSPHVQRGFAKAAVETSERLIVWAGMRAGEGISNDYGWMIVTDHEGMPIP